jgi:hypothetical protein
LIHALLEGVSKMQYLNLRREYWNCGIKTSISQYTELSQIHDYLNMLLKWKRMEVHSIYMQKSLWGCPFGRWVFIEHLDNVKSLTSQWTCLMFTDRRWSKTCSNYVQESVFTGPWYKEGIEAFNSDKQQNESIYKLNRSRCYDTYIIKIQQ